MSGQRILIKTHHAGMLVARYLWE